MTAAMMLEAEDITPRTPIYCEGCGQIVAWRLPRSGALVPIIAQNVQDDWGDDWNLSIRIRCHACARRMRLLIRDDTYQRG